MDEVKLKKIRFHIINPQAWESFLSDVMDLPVSPTELGLEVECSGICFHLHTAPTSGIEWEFSLPLSEREIILSRWSFYQYRSGGEVSLSSANDSLRFQIDAQSSVVVNFESLHICEPAKSENDTVRNF